MDVVKAYNSKSLFLVIVYPLGEYKYYGRVGEPAIVFCEESFCVGDVVRFSYINTEGETIYDEGMIVYNENEFFISGYRNLDLNNLEFLYVKKRYKSLKEESRFGLLKVIRG